MTLCLAVATPRRRRCRTMALPRRDLLVTGAFVSRCVSSASPRRLLGVSLVFHASLLGVWSPLRSPAQPSLRPLFPLFSCAFPSALFGGFLAVLSRQMHCMVSAHFSRLQTVFFPNAHLFCLGCAISAAQPPLLAPLSPSTPPTTPLIHSSPTLSPWRGLDEHGRSRSSPSLVEIPPLVQIF